MKHVIHKLRVGDKVWAQVVEILPDQMMIVSFYGDLVRVKNESPKSFRVGDKVLVRAAQLQPLQFQIITERQERANRLNVSV